MKYIIFIILIALIIFIYFYYENKLYNTKKQLRITSNQYRDIRTQYRDSKLNDQSLTVKFINPQSKTAIANNKANVYLAPLFNSHKLKTLTTKMEVNILDTAIVNNSTWYYVALPIDSQFNCRGWINQRDFTILSSSPSAIITPAQR